jgi:uncharacterized protein with HEPN domain
MRNSHPRHPPVSAAFLEKMGTANERLRHVQLAGPPQPTVHEYFRKGLLTYGHSPGRRDMSPAHQLSLVERYPRLYRAADEQPTGMIVPFARHGFSVGDGWFHLIDRLSAKLATDPAVTAVQVKEKFGVLRFYTSDRSNLRPMLHRAIGKAVAASRRTCEICGKRGKLAARRRGWLSVRCEPCNRIDIMEEACHHLADLSRGLSLARFRKLEIRVAAARYQILHLGISAGYQSPQRRARLPGVDWERLENLQSAIVVNRLTPAQVWKFMKKEARAIARALK